MTVTHRKQFQTSIQRDSWVEVNLSALERNYKKIKDIVKVNIMAVLKADAYGHGATAIAPVLQKLGVNSFGVATVDEGIALRNAGITLPILMLGAAPSWSYDTCIENNLAVAVFSKEQFEKLEELCCSKNSMLKAHLKIDTGMNRLGIDCRNYKELVNKILNSKWIKVEGIFSHLSHPVEQDFSLLQKERFDSVLTQIKEKNLEKHFANTYAAINNPEFRYNLVRIGIGLYGQEFDFLEPLISVKGRVTEIHKVLKGDFISYERTWKAQKDSLIATVPIGYADGVDRKLSNKISAIYNGERIKQVGTITMDQMMFDISEIKDPKANDVIILIDKEIPISNWAKELNTITYELICRLKIRLPKVYTRD